MDDLISRQAAIDALFELYEYHRDIDPTEAADLVRQGIFLAEKKIEKLPSADRPQGEWIGEADGYADGELVYDTWYCSNCDYVVYDDEPPTWNYCPNCGCYNGSGQSD